MANAEADVRAVRRPDREQPHRPGISRARPMSVPHSGGMGKLLRAVAADKGRIRVLLLARNRGQWWELLHGEIPAVRELLSYRNRISYFSFC
jgi:hypothetical protein